MICVMTGIDEIMEIYMLITNSSSVVFFLLET